ncbi:leucine carboxyl methyltransferase 1 isoform X2 [Ixodes scapularis]|nr:leucine carboxyl methyltransferase 1 isoform X2 [Ixodes scapularis]
MTDEDPVIQTNLDAAVSKRDAVTKGYWSDPYIQYFVKPSERKAPEISRGYYARVHGVKTLLDKFLKLVGPDCQIVNLGAGFDTLFWRLMDDKAQFKSLVEVDLPAVTTRKVYYIRLRKPLLKGIVTEDDDVKVNSSDLHAGHYHLVGCDLRELDVFEAKVVHESGLDVSLPTLFIAECVLVYMSCDESSALLSWITRNFPHAVLVTYDPVNMDDKFAEVMVENLKQRNCLLAGLQACTTLKTQEERIRSTGWEACTAWTMSQVYHSIPAPELHRVEKLEMLDEQELLEQLLTHYCLCVAYKGGGSPSVFAKLQFT